MSKVLKIKRFIFLKDVFIIALSAFGGPNMHLALYQRRMVDQKKYLTQSELLELYSLCQMLPGPSSTQTITSMGYKFGGPFLAFLTLIVWVLPAFVILTTLVLLFPYINESFGNIFKYIQPLVVAFIMVAAFDMIKKIAKSKLSIALIVISFTVAGLMRHTLGDYVKTPWLFPVLITFGGLVSYFYNRDEINSQPVTKVKAPWRILYAFIFIFVGVAIVGKITDSVPLKLLENTFRFGTMVFGGGTVLINPILEHFVYFKGYLTPEEFNAGFALVQVVPGPIFTISTFICGLAMRGIGSGAAAPLYQILGSTLGTVGIFLPGTLMIFFVYPIWNQIKEHKIIQKSLKGVIASSAGLVAAAAYLIFLPVGLNWSNAVSSNFEFANLLPENYVNWENIILIVVVSLLLKYTSLPAPVWVVIALIAGLIF